MHKRSGKDVNEIAAEIVQEVVDAMYPANAIVGKAMAAAKVAKAKNPAAVALGRMGGLKGGKARAASLSKTQRSDIARRAAAARWGAKTRA
jgi:hypothetical protein